MEEIVFLVRFVSELVFCTFTLFVFCFCFLRGHAQITTTKVVALGPVNPSVSVPRNGKRTRPGSLAHVIHDQSYWANADGPIRKKYDVIDNQ